MNRRKVISVFEHQRLRIGEQGFEQKHLDALLKLNDYHNGTYFEPIAKGIKFNQFVGVIQVDGITIEINPKADKDDDDNKWKGVLLKMLIACGKLKAQSSGAANVNRQNLNLLEVYFELYLNEVEGLIHKGLVKKYRFSTNNTKALKGKLEFAGHIQKNSIHKERFYTRHQVYDTDHLIHQILQVATSIVEQFSRGSRLYDKIKRIQLSFPLVKQIKVSANELNNISLSRKTQPYTYALELARLIILNFSPDISTGNEKMLSLLFDMNELWETYILKKLKLECNDLDIIVTGQESKAFWGSNSLRPDIVLKIGNETIIVDTKWKRPNRSSASVSDLRQMYSYCRFWNAKKAMLLYPGNLNENEFKSYQTKDYHEHAESPLEIIHQCKMGFVSVLNSKNELDDTIGVKVLNLLDIQK